jgi:hypothetical protein
MKTEKEKMQNALDYYYNQSKERLVDINKHGVYDDWEAIILDKYIIEFHSNKVSEDTRTYQMIRDKNGAWSHKYIHLEEALGCDWEDIEGVDMTSLIRDHKLKQLGV